MLLERAPISELPSNISTMGVFRIKMLFPDTHSIIRYTGKENLYPLFLSEVNGEKGI